MCRSKIFSDRLGSRSGNELTGNKGQVMEWISVKDNMPGTSQNPVIVYKIGYTPDIAYFINTPEFYYFCIGSEAKQIYEPDYWCPIPKQPERLSEKTSKEDAIV